MTFPSFAPARRGVALLLLTQWLMAARPARAQVPDGPLPATPAEAATADPTVSEARQAFVLGARLVEESNFADALAAFEKSYALRRHPVTLFNMGVCERALGQQARARRTFGEALAQHAQSGGLPQALAENAAAYASEIDRTLAHVDVTLDPPSAALAVDGRPLQHAEPASAAAAAPWTAGLRPPGPGESPGSKRFTLRVDPGPHVFVVSRKGFADVVVRRTFAPAARDKLILELRRLPATLQIDASEKGAIVRVDAMDVGAAPVAVSRPAGTYRVSFHKPGFEPYETRVVAQPGEETRIRAALRPHQPGLAERWWFWAGVGALAVGAGAVTYAVTRPDPTQPPVQGGTLGWGVDLR